MTQSNKLFNGKKLRAVYDKSRKLWLVSAIDVISAITNSNYDTARNYWKQFKLRLKKRNHSLARKTRQIKLLAKDGLYRYTDVIDYREIVKIIQALPYKTAVTLKNWIGGIACKANKIKKDLEYCVKQVSLPKEHWFVRHTSFKRIF